MDVGDHEFLQVRTLIGDTDELRHNLYVLMLKAGFPMMRLIYKGH